MNVNIRKGRLIYFMGASGAGKDSIISGVKQQLPKDLFLFAQRFITRRAGPSEDNIYIPPDEFDFLANNGIFIFFWRSNEESYGISKRILQDLNNSRNVVVNGSREYYEKALVIYPDIVPVIVTVSDDIRTKRLRSRGRENEKAIRARLARRYDIPQNAYHIDNSGLLEDSVNLFKAFLMKKL